MFSFKEIDMQVSITQGLKDRLNLGSDENRKLQESSSASTTYPFAFLEAVFGAPKVLKSDAAVWSERGITPEAINDVMHGGGFRFATLGGYGFSGVYVWRNRLGHTLVVDPRIVRGFW